MSENELRTDFEVKPAEYPAILGLLIEEVGLDEDLHVAAELSLEWSAELPYHHYGHTLGTARRALEIAKERGLDHYSIKVLLLAALWHDADYGSPLGDEYPSREHRSAHLAYQTIMGTCSEEKLEETALFATHVATVILGTNADHDSSDPLVEILNTADLANLYHEDPRIMLRETGAFFVEGLYLGGVATRAQLMGGIGDYKDELESWIVGAKSYVERLVREKLDPNDERSRKAVQNMRQMTADRVLDVLQRK